MSHSARAPASRLVIDHLDALREAERLGPVLDLACGRGRHALALARAGIPCLGIDRNPDHLSELRGAAARDSLPVTLVRADLETESQLPLITNSCGAILVFRFLYRPLFPAFAEALVPGGLLLYETFAAAHRDTGRGPRSPAFYLESGELPQLASDLEILAYEEGPDERDPPDITARLIARKPR